MPNWKEVLGEIQLEINNKNPAPLDTIRRKYLNQIHQHTKRNLIAYYSGWLQGRNPMDSMVNDKDKNAFMVNNGRSLFQNTTLPCWALVNMQLIGLKNLQRNGSRETCAETMRQRQNSF